MAFLKKTLKKLDLRPFTFNPPLLLSVMLLVIIMVGTLLLKLPFAAEHPISWMEALFFSTSASTVTGLTPSDPGETFTFFGEIVLLLLIQVGGIGVMSFAVFFVILLGRKITIKQRQLMQEALNQPSIGGVIRLVSWIFSFSFVIECIGAFFLACRFVPDYGWGMGIYYSIFHSVSGFNQAGFSLFHNSMSAYVGDPIVNLTLIMLITLGGIGFTVLSDLISSKHVRDLTLHSKVMLIGTLVVNIAAFFIIFSIEFGNSESLGSLSGSEKIWASLFQSVSPHSAGLTTVDPVGLTDATLLLTMVMMFIGAGSTSTSGGIKLTTFMIIIAEVISFLKGKKDVVLLKRTINHPVIVRAVSITSISVLVIFIALFLLCITEDMSFLMILFEVVSAFGTAGESIGATADLSGLGQVIIMCVMFFGKVGPLTLAFSVARPSRVDIHYPDGEIYTG